MSPAFETVATYPTAIAAELAAAALRNEGIAARLRDAQVSSVLPHLTAAFGYVKLDVPAADAERARALLRDIEATETDDLSDEPRCPACGSTYLAEKRGQLECQRCGARFDPEDAAEPLHGAGADGYRGRARRQKLRGDVFRLRRDRKGMGLFLGFMVGFASTLAMGAGPQGPALMLGLAALGWVVGRAWIYFECSEGSCRARLRSDMKRCPACSGAIHGEIERAADHWVRREALRRARDKSVGESEEGA
jgi:ribosomal protein S27AE